MRVKRKAGPSYDNLSFTTLAATVAACAHGTVYNNTTLLLLLYINYHKSYLYNFKNKF